MPRSSCFLAFLLALAIRVRGLCEALDDEGSVLLRFRDRVELDPSGALSGWRGKGGNEDHCFWLGIQCSSGRVVALNLKNLGLKGTVAPELATLLNLQQLILHNNSFYGTIPREIFELKMLEVLDLGENNLSGPISPMLSSMSSWKTLVLVGNRFVASEFSEPHGITAITEVGLVELIFSTGTSVARNVKSAIARKLMQVGIRKDHAPGNGGAEASSSPSPSARAPSSPRFPPVGSTSPERVSSPSKIFSSVEHLRPNVHSISPTASKVVNHSSTLIVYASVAGGFVIVALSLFYYYYCRWKKVEYVIPWSSPATVQSQKALMSGDTLVLDRSELEAACEGFSNIIGTFSDYTLYKGTLSSGVEIAVSSAVTPTKNSQKYFDSQFKKKISALTQVEHKNFMNLLGYCEVEKPLTRMMVFEYAPNGTLFEHLHIKEAEHLDWDTRLRIVMGVAYCLEHLHQLKPPVILRDLNSTTIYLTEDYSAKVSDLGFGNGDGEEEGGAIEGRHASPSADSRSVVYKFGVVFLEILSGRRPFSEDYGLLVRWASSHLNGGRPLRDMIDSTLEPFREEDLAPLCEVLSSCIAPSRRRRPTMAEVASQLRAITSIAPEAATSRNSPLLWAELQLLSIEAC